MNRDQITVSTEAGLQVQLGIKTPERLPIYREEIWLAVQAENLAAASVDSLLLGPEWGRRCPCRGGAKWSRGGKPGCRE